MPRDEDVDDADDDVEWIHVRGRSYRREVPAPGASPMRFEEKRSSLVRTEVSFGLAGRLACTVVVLVPIWRFIASGSLFWLLAVVAMIPAAVWWIRDTWRRV